MDAKTGITIFYGIQKEMKSAQKQPGCKKGLALSKTL